MRAELSQAYINSIKIPKKIVTVHDTKVPGFYVRIQPTGCKSYGIYWTAQRKQYRVTICRVGVLTFAKARAEATRLKAVIALGGNPALERKKNREEASAELTLDEFLTQQYHPWSLQNRSILTGGAARVRATLPSLLKRKLQDITVHQVEICRTNRLSTGTQATTINRDVATLKVVLQKAIDWGVLKVHPLAGLKELKTNKKEPRFLTRDEFDALIDASRTADANHNCKKPMTTIIIVAAYTGMRKSEITALKWIDINRHMDMITIRAATSKTGLRYIPINDTCRTALTQWRDGATEGYVFPARHGGRLEVSLPVYQALLLNAGLHYPVDDPRRVKFHTLRHTFASWLVQAGIALNTVRELMGHTDIKTTQIYAHLAPKNMADAVQAIG